MTSSLFLVVEDVPWTLCSQKPTLRAQEWLLGSLQGKLIHRAVWYSHICNDYYGNLQTHRKQRDRYSEPRRPVALAGMPARSGWVRLHPTHGSF